MSHYSAVHVRIAFKIPNPRTYTGMLSQLHKILDRQGKLRKYTMSLQCLTRFWPEGIQRKSLVACPGVYLNIPQEKLKLFRDDIEEPAIRRINVACCIDEFRGQELLCTYNNLYTPMKS